MKPILKLTAFILLAGILVYLSCKKEYSCEGCINGNKPPIANAGPDRVITLPTDSVSLDGTASSDPDGRISSFLWTKISGPVSFTINNASSVTAVAKNLIAGAYQFELKVTDNGGMSAKDSMQIIVNDPSQPNRPPVANAGPDQTITLPTTTANLDGSGSTDPDNNITGYAWTKISGPASFNIANSNTAQIQATNLVQGAYQFELNVTDSGGLFSKDTVQIIVNAVINHPPIANAGLNQTITLPNNTVTLDGSGSTDPDNNITGYAWTRISGPASFNIANSNTAQTQVTNLVPGIYRFELKVTDAGGLFSKDTMQVAVLDLPCGQLPPIATVCDNTTRLQICAQLIPIGTISQTRYRIAVASGGTKVLFAGGNLPDGMFGAGSTRVDIYDWVTNTWSTTELSQGRGGMATAVLNDKKIFFGGGYKDENRTSSKVDIYDVVTNTWTTDELSLSRTEMAAASTGEKVVFAGGVHAEDGYWSGGSTFTDRVDIYDAITNTWSVAALTEKYRTGMSATTIGSKIYFAGGTGNWSVFDYNPTSKIDIYDADADSWTQSSLSQLRGFHGAIAVNNKNYWAGGDTEYGNYTNSVEIRDANTQNSIAACLFQINGQFNAVLKNNKIVFFTGSGIERNKFDIYDILTNTWSIGVLPVEIYGASIISANNTIYVAGGYVNGVLSNQVWKLEF